MLNPISELTMPLEIFGYLEISSPCGNPRTKISMPDFIILSEIGIKDLFPFLFIKISTSPHLGRYSVL